MIKKIIAASLIMTSALSLGACGEMTVSEIGDDGKVTSSYTVSADEIMDYDSTQYHSDETNSEIYAENSEEASNSSGNDGYIYYQIEDRERKSVLADPNQYESGNSSDSDEEMFAEIDGTLMNAFGLTYSILGDSCQTVYTMDEMPYLYGIEDYSNHANEIYLMQQEGSERFGDNDICVGAFGWLSRVFVFEHEWSASVKDFTDALRENYPDCTELQFTDKSIIPSAPSNIGNTLAYVDFTAPFCAAGNTKVRLYIEASSEDSGASSDTWVYLQKI